MIPISARESWRTWLLTGTRSDPPDKRRLRGAHRGLKKLLLEGMINGLDRPRPWKDFSGAMVRQAVNEALHSLPPEQHQVVKLAYFGGLSNREIARHLGLSVAGVQQRLRQAVAYVSDHIEHGRNAGRRAMYGLMLWLPSRRFAVAAPRAAGAGSTHLVQATALVAAGIAAVSIAAQPVPTARHTPAQQPVHTLAPKHPATGATRPRSSTTLPSLPAGQKPVTVPVTVPSVSVPPRVVPPLPPLPKLPKSVL